MLSQLSRSRALVLLLALVLITPIAVGLPAVTPPVAQAVASPDEKIDPALLDRMSANPTKLLPIIVEMNDGRTSSSQMPLSSSQMAHTADSLLRSSGLSVGALNLIGAASGFADAAGIQMLCLDSRVAYIDLDYTVGPGRPQSTTIPPASQLSAPYPKVVNADDMWQLGATGKGIGVAVLDSGIAPDADLTQPTNRLVAAVNFADDRGSLPDPGGHGTHMAGIIAGNGTRSAGEYVGIAPDATIIDVRVLDRNGNGRVSSVVRGIEWVLAHQAQYNIRVINLSFGAVARNPNRLDPLAAAAQMAWQRGLVVVAAAGNRGPAEGTVESPGIDPDVITVGATDDQGTIGVGDDTLAWFSAWATPSGSISRPDLVAPGRRIVSLRVPGSYLDQLFPDRIVVAKNGATYFRLTGTSTSTAIVSGIAALLLELQPDLTADQVKAALVTTTQQFGQASGSVLPDPAADGAGLVDALAASQVSLSSIEKGRRPSNAFARAVYPALYGQRLVWKDPHYLGIDWNSLDWETLVWNNAAWDNVAWDAFQWSNAAWDNAAWDNAAWDNAAWDNAAWDTTTWSNLALD